MSTRQLLDLRATERRTESYDTLYSEVDRTLTRWCGSNRLPQAGPLPPRRVAGESLETLSRTCSCSGVGGAVDVLPHNVLHSA
jgi:hypothetical protein